MKSGVAAGAIAGLVGGIVGDIVGAIGYYAGLFEMESANIAYSAVIGIVLTIIFGTIFGAIYSRFHDQIPGIGVSKGLYFGLMIWLIKDIAAGAYIGFVEGVIPTAIWLQSGFFMWITYGPLLGALYKK
jgi:hypothetical protein